VKIVFSSRNKNKIREIETILGEFTSKSGICDSIEVLSLDDIGLEGEIEENGETFEENALIKARAASALGYIALADDSGLEVDALGGEPGVYSARYSGQGATDEKNNELLLSRMACIPKGKRGAKFVSVIACSFPDDREPILCRGEIEGEMLFSGRGNGGFGYDPLFYVPELGCTFAEAGSEAKNKISHRGKAMQKLCKYFAEGKIHY
jgi:XTP/dITP diphosphohydrolase